MKQFVRCYLCVFGNSTGRPNDVDNIRRVATTYIVNSKLHGYARRSVAKQGGICPSYFLKWMDALRFAPPPTFSSLRPNRCVPFHAVIIICDFRVIYKRLRLRLFIPMQIQKEGRSPHGRAVIIFFINKRLLMRRQFTTNISTRNII